MNCTIIAVLLEQNTCVNQINKNQCLNQTAQFTTKNYNTMATNDN